MHQSPQHENPGQQNASPESEGKGKSLAPPAFQLKASEGPAAPPPVQRKENSNGLPSELTSGFAASTGHDLSDVNVHHNSDKPSQVGALAYAQGNDIHLAQVRSSTSRMRPPTWCSSAKGVCRQIPA